MVLSTLVRRHDRSFVVHLLEPAINLNETLGGEQNLLVIQASVCYIRKRLEIQESVICS